MIRESVMDTATVSTWMTEIAEAVRENRDYLVQLDAAIGDGDHGINMTRGFDAVIRALAAEAEAPPGMLLTLAGKTLVSSVGGASGPLWGSALRRAGRTLGEAPTFAPKTLPAPWRRRWRRSRTWARRDPETRPWSTRWRRPLRHSASG